MPEEKDERYTRGGLPILQLETIKTKGIEVKRSLEVSIEEDVQNELKELVKENPLVAKYVSMIPQIASEFFPNEKSKIMASYFALMVYSLLKSQANNYKVEDMLKKTR